MSLLVLVLLPHASASVFVGNPTNVIAVDRPAHDLTHAFVTIAKVRVNYCGGGYTDYAVNETVDLVADPYTHTISGGDLCGIRVYWSTAMTIDSSSFELDYEQAYTDVFITSGPQPATLSPFTVVSGSISGTGPKLVVNLTQ